MTRAATRVSRKRNFSGGQGAKPVRMDYGCKESTWAVYFARNTMTKAPKTSIGSGGKGARLG